MTASATLPRFTIKQSMFRMLVLAVVSVFAATLVFSENTAFAGSKKRNVLLGIGIGIGIGAAIARGKRKLRKKSRKPRRKTVRAQRPAKKRVATRKKTKPVKSAAYRDGIKIQTALAALGLYSMGIDGDLGPGSRRSISEFQQQQGFTPTGRLDREQRTLLFALADGQSAPNQARGGIVASAPVGTESDIFGNSNAPSANDQNGETTVFGAPPAANAEETVIAKTPKSIEGLGQNQSPVLAAPATAPADDELESIFEAPSESKVAVNAEAKAAPQRQKVGSSLFD